MWFSSCSLRAMVLPSTWKNAKPASFAAFCTTRGSLCAGRNQTPPRFSSSIVARAFTDMSGPIRGFA